MEYRRRDGVILAEIIIPGIIMFAISFLAGATAHRMPNADLRIIYMIVSVAGSTAYLVSVVENKIIDTGTKSVEATLGLQHEMFLIAVFVMSGVSFYFVWRHGRKMTDRERAEAQRSLKTGIRLARDIIDPMLKRQNADIANTLNAIKQKDIDASESRKEEMEGIGAALDRLSQAFYGLASRVAKLEELASKTKEYFENVPDLYETLIARIESIAKNGQPGGKGEPEEDGQEEDAAGKGKSDSSGGKPSGPATKPAAQAGRQGSGEGYESRKKALRSLKAAELDLLERHGLGEPNLTIRKRVDGELRNIAVVSIKCYSIADQPKRRQRSISAKRCQPELNLAKRLKRPFALLVINALNGRVWMRIFSVDELSTWKSVSTPIMLAKEDEESGRQLQEDFDNAIVELGGKA